MTSQFPAWFYGPDGQARIFDCAEDIPAGWVDAPCKAIAAVADMAASIARFDHDGDGRPGGSKPRRKKAVKRDDG